MGSRGWSKKFGVELKDIPDSPGVYRFLDEQSALLYVGKAKNLRSRLNQYHTPRPYKEGRRERKIVRLASRLQWEVTENELAACLREVEIIQLEGPRLNKAFSYSGRYPFVGLRIEGNRLAICLTRHLDVLEGYGVAGAFRSGLMSFEAIHGLSVLLRQIGHLDSIRSRRDGMPPGTYAYEFRQIPTGWGDLWKAYFLGTSAAALQELVLRLLDKKSARAKAKEIQEHIDALKNFWVLEAQPLRQVMVETNFGDPFVPQKERDKLFLKYRFRGEIK